MLQPWCSHGAQHTKTRRIQPRQQLPARPAAVRTAHHLMPPGEPGLWEAVQEEHQRLAAAPFSAHCVQPGAGQRRAAQGRAAAGQSNCCMAGGGLHVCSSRNVCTGLSSHDAGCRVYELVNQARQRVGQHQLGAVLAVQRLPRPASVHVGQEGAGMEVWQWNWVGSVLAAWLATKSHRNSSWPRCRIRSGVARAAPTALYNAHSA